MSSSEQNAALQIISDVRETLEKITMERFLRHHYLARRC
jgi:hypothetical protein